MYRARNVSEWRHTAYKTQCNRATHVYTPRNITLLFTWGFNNKLKSAHHYSPFTSTTAVDIISNVEHWKQGGVIVLTCRRIATHPACWWAFHFGHFQCLDDTDDDRQPTRTSSTKHTAVYVAWLSRYWRGVSYSAPMTLAADQPSACGLPISVQ